MVMVRVKARVRSSGLGFENGFEWKKSGYVLLHVRLLCVVSFVFTCF